MICNSSLAVLSKGFSFESRLESWKNALFSQCCQENYMAETSGSQAEFEDIIILGLLVAIVLSSFNQT